MERLRSIPVLVRDVVEPGKNFTVKNFRENRKSRLSVGPGFFPYCSNFSSVLNSASPILLVCIWAVNKRPKTLLIYKNGTLNHLQPSPAPSPASRRGAVQLQSFSLCGCAAAFVLPCSSSLYGCAVGLLHACTSSSRAPSTRQVQAYNTTVFLV